MNLWRLVLYFLSTSFVYRSPLRIDIAFILVSKSYSQICTNSPQHSSLLILSGESLTASHTFLLPLSSVLCPLLCLLLHAHVPEPLIPCFFVDSLAPTLPSPLFLFSFSLSYLSASPLFRMTPFPCSPASFARTIVISDWPHSTVWTQSSRDTVSLLPFLSHCPPP